jgi:hypothetical protein
MLEILMGRSPTSATSFVQEDMRGHLLHAFQAGTFVGQGGPGAFPQRKVHIKTKMQIEVYISWHFSIF